MKIRSKLAYIAAGLTVLATVLVPFVLINFFTHGVEASGLHVDEVYVAGPVVRTIEKDGYRIDVHKDFRPRLLQRVEPYVQLAWEPAKSLPTQIADEVDIDGDGKPDVRVSFVVPQNNDNMRVNVEPLSQKYIALHGVGKESFSRMIAEIDGKIIVRIPMQS